MEELSTKRQSELAWGSIANIVDKISDEEEKIDGGWPELIDVVADAMTEEGSVKSTANAFANLFKGGLQQRPETGCHHHARCKAEH